MCHEITDSRVAMPQKSADMTWQAITQQRKPEFTKGVMSLK
jgi:hypothetical protein